LIDGRERRTLRRVASMFDPRAALKVALKDPAVA